MEYAKEGKEGVAPDEDCAGALERELPTPQAHRDKPDAKAQQRGKHRQAAHVHEHRLEDDRGLVPQAVVEHATEVVTGGAVVRVRHPRGGQVRHRDAEQRQAAGHVGHHHARALLSLCDGPFAAGSGCIGGGGRRRHWPFGKFGAVGRV